MSPHETFFLGGTSKVEQYCKFTGFVKLIYIVEIDNNSHIEFTIKDFPGNYEFKETNANDRATFKNCKSIVYVIDAQQQDFEVTCQRLRDIIKIALSINPKIQIEVFIHKVDTDMFLSEDQKMDTLNDVQEMMRSLLNEINIYI